jgi:hypothetical protein
VKAIIKNHAFNFYSNKKYACSAEEAGCCNGKTGSAGLRLKLN